MCVQSDNSRASFIGCDMPELRARISRYSPCFIDGYIADIIFQRDVKSGCCPTDMAADTDTMFVKFRVGTHKKIRMCQVGEQSAFHAFDSAFFIKVEHIPISGMMPEVGKLFVSMVMVVSKEDIIQPVLFDDFFQPVDVFGKVFILQSDFDADLIPVFFFS